MPEVADPPIPADLEPEVARKLAELLKMAADPTRLRVLVMLSAREMTIPEMCSALGLSQPALSHCLRWLRVTDLVGLRRAGRVNVYLVTTRGWRLARAAWSLTRE
jgi:DNA-binding transcriptional ArsR family regulator